MFHLNVASKSMEKSLVILQQKKAVILTTGSLSFRAIFENEKTQLGTRLSHLAAENKKCLPSVWKTRKFRGEFKWKGSSWWKFPG